ncbi:MAG: acyltransferase family protein [Paludibacter sp.]|nr:acyltransferase family protein [Paludibacter sp.]
MKRIEIIEFLKGYSIFTIVLFHYLQTFHWQNIAGKLIFFGGTGVHLFIFLSGFGLYYSHLHKQLNFSAFIKKRMSKVYYPYIIIVIISALISLFIPIYKNSWYALGGHIFLYKMFDESIIGSYGYPLWFISMIIQFYLAFYLILKLRKITGEKYFFIVSFIISLLWTIIIIVTNKDIYRVWNSFFLKYLWEFALGMILAETYYNNEYKLNLTIKRYYFLLIGIANCILYAFLALKAGVTGKMLNDVPALIGYSSIAVWIYLLRIKPLNSGLKYIGKISYAFYLLHTLVLLLVAHYCGEIYRPLLLTISLLLSILIANYYQKFIAYISVTYMKIKQKETYNNQK